LSKTQTSPPAEKTSPGDSNGQVTASEVKVKPEGVTDFVEVEEARASAIFDSKDQRRRQNVQRSTSDAQHPTKEERGIHAAFPSDAASAKSGRQVGVRLSRVACPPALP